MSHNNQGEGAATIQSCVVTDQQVVEQCSEVQQKNSKSGRMFSAQQRIFEKKKGGENLLLALKREEGDNIINQHEDTFLEY